MPWGGCGLLLCVGMQGWQSEGHGLRMGLGLLSAPLCCRGSRQGRGGCSAAEGFCIEPVSSSARFTTCGSSARCWALGVSCWKTGAFVHLPKAVPAWDDLQCVLCSLLRVTQQLCSWCRYSAHSGAVNTQPGSSAGSGTVRSPGVESAWVGSVGCLTLSALGEEGPRGGFFP